MRVGMICPYSLGLWGGVQSQVLGLARTLRREGVDVQVLAPCDGLPPEPWVTPLGNSMPYAQNGSLAPVAPDPAAQLRVLRAIWDDRFDLLHLHEPLAPGPTLTSIVVKPVPLIGTFHASGEIAVYRYLRPLLQRLTGRLGLRVAVSAEAASMVQRHLGATCEVLFNGVETARFAGTPDRPAHKRASGRPAALFLARHEPRKGLSVFLEAGAHLPADVELWVGGSGPETARLRSLYGADTRIQWLGDLDEEEKAQRMLDADVFCVPSLGGESFGVVLLEAMAAGTPVAASDLEAYRLTSRDGVDARLFRTGNARQLAASILELIENGPAVADMVASGSQRAGEFSMDRLALAYLERYERLVR